MLFNGYGTANMLFYFRNKTQRVRQRKIVSSNKKKNKVAISFKLSEFNPQYEILPPCQDTNPYVAISRISDTKTERAEVITDSKFSKTNYQNMKTAKPTTSCSKVLRTKPISLPPILPKSTTKQYSKNGSSKTYMHIS